MKLLCALMIVLLVGCASQPTQSGFDISDYDTFKPDCARARAQVDYLQNRIADFHSYFKARTPTLAERKYYTRLKNNLWTLRSSCSVLQQ